MPIPEKALALENRNLGVDYEATLADAYAILKDEWNKGSRDRELALHLMFIAWYGIIEPEHITGFSRTDQERHELNQIVFEVHEYFKDKINNDAEMLYAFGLMAYLEWYMLEHSEYWKEIAGEYQSLYRALAPNGIDVSIYENRGAYGEYYAGQVEASKLPNGY